MELFYSELKKREVINVTDGRSLGFIMDLKLKFPEGKLLGIVVPGRKTCALLRIFDKSRVYIEECKIIKIGGDVILVNLKDGRACKDTRPQIKPCQPNVCAPVHPKNQQNQVDFSLLSGSENGDYYEDY